VVCNASRDVQHTDSIKFALAAAKPVGGAAISPEMFNGIPLVFVFFAS
jgi:hypothetical protein